ncbi:hypothetical protein [Mangrovitalea sediminis]|uniref:hypothetical protein n=1 Tax=Mangrovitalea sediminis TaxID=1982043 RepID=UPI000BE54ECB|nr:hypothetical protein [Mangrovitalea sediminis]
MRVLTLCLTLLLTACAWQPVVDVYRQPAPGEPRFYVVSVFRGVPTPEEKIRYDFDYCNWNPRDPDCMSILMHQVTYVVDVQVKDTAGPLTLGLSAYDRTLWRLHVAPGVDLKRVILSGRYPQTIEGVPATTQVDLKTSARSECKRCTELPGDYSYLKLFDYRRPAALYDWTVPLPVTAFQGRFEGGSFTIPPQPEP